MNWFKRPKLPQPVCRHKALLAGLVLGDSGIKFERVWGKTASGDVHMQNRLKTGEWVTVKCSIKIGKQEAEFIGPIYTSDKVEDFFKER